MAEARKPILPFGSPHIDEEHLRFMGLELVYGSNPRLSEIETHLFGAPVERMTNEQAVLISRYLAWRKNGRPM